MTQIDTDAGKDEQIGRELEWPCVTTCLTIVEPLCQGANGAQAVGATVSTAAPGLPLDYGRLVFNLRPSVLSADCSTPRRFEARLH